LFCRHVVGLPLRKMAIFGSPLFYLLWHIPHQKVANPGSYFTKYDLIKDPSNYQVVVATTISSQGNIMQCHQEVLVAHNFSNI
jgi:hypothetical protein